MEVGIKYNNGKVYLEHNNVEIRGLHIKYYFDEPNNDIDINLPKNWLYSSNMSDIIMINMGYSYLEDQHVLFEYSGKIIIPSAEIVTNNMETKTIRLKKFPTPDSFGSVKSNEPTISNMRNETFGNETKIENIPISDETQLLRNKRISNLELYKQRYYNINKQEKENEQDKVNIKSRIMNVVKNLRGSY